MKILKPYFWDNRKLSFFSILLLPFTIFVIINNYFIKFKKNKKIYKEIKTICVGNIYVGGTGKTPLAIEISKLVKRFRYKTTFIKKFYKESLDEQILLKKNGNCICSSISRSHALHEAITKKYNLAIFDDGLQDSSVNYDLKFVCFNAEKFLGNGFLIPAGPLREKLSSLNKYDAVFLNGETKDIKTKISVIKKYNKDIKIFETNYYLTNQSDFLKKDKYIAFAGIGIPENFHNILKANNFDIVRFLKYPDHYNYSKLEIDKIKKIAKSLNAKIITTEKDYLRIMNRHNLKKNQIKSVKMRLKIKTEKKFLTFLKSRI